MFNKEEYLFITTCSKTKSYLDDTPIPLTEMYSGRVFRNRYNLMKTLSDEVYFCTPSGPGIVRDNWVTAPYNQMTPNSKLYSKEFQMMHRQLFEQRYPGRLDKVKRIFWLGSAHYDDFLKAVFYDKEVVVCMQGKLTAARFSSYIIKVQEMLDSVSTTLKNCVWVENETHFLTNEKWYSETSGNLNRVNRYKKPLPGSESTTCDIDFNYTASQFARDLFGVSHAEMKQMMIDKCGMTEKLVSNITMSMILSLCKAMGVDIHKGKELPCSVTHYDPLTEDFFHPLFKDYIREFMNNKK